MKDFEIEIVAYLMELYSKVGKLLAIMAMEFRAKVEGLSENYGSICSKD